MILCKDCRFLSIATRYCSYNSMLAYEQSSKPDYVGTGTIILNAAVTGFQTFAAANCRPYTRLSSDKPVQEQRENINACGPDAKWFEPLS